MQTVTQAGFIAAARPPSMSAMRTVPLLAVLLATACHTSNTVVAPDGDVAASFQADVAARLRADVAWLADDAREGRRAGTQQGLEAGRWIAERLRAVGLEPAGEKGTYEQEFRVPLEPRAGGGSWLKFHDGPRLAESDTKLAPLFCAERGEVSGMPDWCGYGIELPEQGWNDFVGRDLTGRIAFVVRGTPRSPPPAPKATEEAPKESTQNPHGGTQPVAAGDPFASAGLVFMKVMNAKRKGAVGVVLVQHPSDAGKPVLAFHEGGSGRAGIPCLSLSWNDARAMFGERIDGWARDLESRPSQDEGVLGPPVAMSADVVRGQGSATNVLGRVRGKDRSRTVVLGAHYDHLGWGGTGSLAPGQRAVHNGADDNASGTAALIEVGRQLAAGPPPPCDVIVALWSGEELGLLGSEWWIEHPTVPLDQVVGNVNLDMVGRADSNKIQVLGAGSSAEFAGWLAEAGPSAGMDLEVSASSSAMAGSSDHATFAKRKKPVLHLFSGLHGDYHKPTDDVERFEAEGAAQVVELTLDLTRRMAGAGAIAFVEPPAAEPGQQRARSGFGTWFGSMPNYAFAGPGVKIDGTSAGSPAERAGFLAGDVLLELGEVEIATIDDFMYALQHYKPGDVVLVGFERDGQREETRVTLSSRGVR